MKCSICRNKITTNKIGWDDRHNAQPVNKGRCCCECNYKVVIPTRLNKLISDRKKNYSKQKS